MRSKRLLVFIALACFYVAGFLIMTYPLAAYLRTHFVIDVADPRAMGDGGMFVWNIETFASSVEAHENPFSTDRILYPLGANLWFHTYTPIAGAAALVFGSAIWTLNAFVFLHFVFSGIGCYALARRFVDDRRLAALAGFAFSYCPYKLAHLLGHFNLELTATIPAFALCFVSWCRSPATDGGPRWAWALGAAVSLVLTAVTDYYYTYYLLWFAVAYAAYWYREERILAFAPRARRWVVPAVVVSTVATVIGNDVLDLETHGPFGYSADLFAYLLPSADQQFAGGSALLALRRALHVETIEHDIYVGIVPLLLLVLYVAGRCHRGAPKALRALSFSCLVFVVLSMPAVRVAGTRLAYLPSALLHLVPFVNHLRVPARFSVMVMLVVPILAMVAVEKKLFSRWSAAKQSLFAGLLLLGLIVDFKRTDYFMTSSEQVPAVYRVLADRPAGTLLEIPFGIRDGLQQAGVEHTSAMWFQTIHHKKLVSGMVARLPERTFDWFRNEPVMADLFAVERMDVPPPTVTRSPQDIAAFVRRFDVRYVLIAPEYRGKPAERYVRDNFGSYAARTEEIGGFSLVTLDPSTTLETQAARLKLPDGGF